MRGVGTNRKLKDKDPADSVWISRAKGRILILTQRRSDHLRLLPSLHPTILVRIDRHLGGRGLQCKSPDEEITLPNEGDVQHDVRGEP